MTTLVMTPNYITNNYYKLEKRKKKKEKKKPHLHIDKLQKIFFFINILQKEIVCHLFISWIVGIERWLIINKLDFKFFASIRRETQKKLSEYSVPKVLQQCSSHSTSRYNGNSGKRTTIPQKEDEDLFLPKQDIKKKLQFHMSPLEHLNQCGRGSTDMN